MMGTDHDAPLTEDFLRGFAARWEVAWNSHDTASVLELLHPQIVFEDTVFWPNVIEGRDAMVPYIEAVWRAMPDVQFVEMQFFTAPADGRALYLFKQTGSAPARYGSGRFATYGCDVFLGFRDGLLSNYLAQYEIVEMMRQYGALPPRGTRTGGGYLLSLLHHQPSG